MAGEEPGGEQQRVAGEEEADEQPGLGEDDQKQPDCPERAAAAAAGRSQSVMLAEDHRDRLDGAFRPSRRCRCDALRACVSLRNQVPGATVAPSDPSRNRVRRAQVPRDRRVQDQGRHHRPLPRRRLHRARQLRPRAGPARARASAVDVDDHFRARVRTARGPGQGSRQPRCASALKGADELYLATDEDREGEAIAWHLLEVLKPKTVPVKRMVFHEITREAIDDAIANPRELDMKLVEAQEGRRALDRLVGYEVSPVLWRRVGGARSAGRVQSVAVRLVVERERERMAFRARRVLGSRRPLRRARHRVRRAPGRARRPAASRPVATSTPRPGCSHPTSDVACTSREADARALAARLADAAFTVASASRRRTSPSARSRRSRPRRCSRRPATSCGSAPAARCRSRRASTSAGYITYMRTDSVQLSRAGGRRGPGADRRAVRPGLPPAGAAHLRQQGEERAGGARGDSPRRRAVPHAGSRCAASSAATSRRSTS